MSLPACAKIPVSGAMKPTRIGSAAGATEAAISSSAETSVTTRWVTSVPPRRTTQPAA